MGDIELLVVDIVEKHIDVAQVVGSQIDFLAEKALAHLVAAKYLDELEQQRTGTAGRVINLVDLALAHHSDASEQFGNLLRGKKLPARFSGIGGIHIHQVFIGIAEHIVCVVGKSARAIGKGQVADGFK